ncbi:glycosyltransferase family 2 protein [Sphingomonas montana]|uniref:glycosyltransferase family 2 protein n=1 Tax=Sphingomonas montana TaxID=1843236 RepID=UPI0013E9C45A|nr:glycosyltransferase family 2 protein [Sphingomonas montana]
MLVPAYRCADYIADTLRSLQAQTMPDWEAIVVDDGSPDDLAGAMAPFSGDARIRLLRTTNAGVSAARNRALADARAPLIALLDGDDRYTPDYLAEMTRAIAVEPDVGFVTCDATFFGNARLEGVRFSAVSPQVPPVTLDRVLGRQFNVFTACLLLATALQDVGGWSVDLRSAEDLDLWIRLLERGWRCSLVPHTLHHYRRRPDSLSSARLPLLHAAARVYDNAIERLVDRPERRTAQTMRATIEAEIAFERGEALVLAGDVRAGLRELRRALPRTATPAWRVALIAMRIAPFAAPRFMRWRMEAALHG